MVGEMLAHNPKKRINISQVCSYFDFLEQDSKQPANLIENSVTEDDGDTVT